MNKIKTHLKNIINGMDMYMKEQRVIAIMLLCFVVSGASLPAIKSHMIENGGETPPNSNFYVDENNQPIDEMPIDDEENEQNSDEPSPDDEQNPNDVQTPSNVQNPNQFVLTKPNSSSGSKPVNNNHQSSSSNNTGSNGSGTSPSSPSKPADNPSSSGSSDKTWVPPVYKTVHHEAVYEKVKVYICNKCKEEFPSAGDFQVHKDLHGG